MIDLANKINKDKKIKYKTIGMKNISSIKERFDVVISSLAFHYVSNYNINGPRTVTWFDTTYTKYHRNFSFLINGLINNNYKICKIVEPIASEENIKNNPKYKNQLNMPYFK